MYEGSRVLLKKNKKILLLIVASMLAVIVLLSVIVGLLERREEQNAVDPDALEIQYPFYPADFDLNIWEDEEYQQLLRGKFLHYCDSYTNVTVSLTKDTAGQHGEEVAFLVDYVYTIIEGDHKAYNACFSDRYYQNGKTPKDAFTMQQLHHIVLTKLSSEHVSENGVNYTKYLYAVEYQIHENNGTFRKDIGDGTRTQYLEVTNRTGEWKIDVQTVVQSKVQ